MEVPTTAARSHSLRSWGVANVETDYFLKTQCELCTYIDASISNSNAIATKKNPDETTPIDRRNKKLISKCLPTNGRHSGTYESIICGTQTTWRPNFAAYDTS